MEQLFPLSTLWRGGQGVGLIFTIPFQSRNS